MSQTTADNGVNMRLAYIALICGGIIGALSFGIRTGFGLFLEPITADLGTGREVFAFSLALQNLIWGATQPFVGALADRYGAYKAIMAGAVFYVVGTALIAVSQSAEMFHFSAGLLVGIGLSGTSFGIILGAVGQLFPPERRSWALGVTGAAGSFGQFAIVPVAQGLLTSFGWADATLILSIGAALMIPLAFAFIKAKPAPTGGPVEKEMTIREALGEAFGYTTYWLLIVGFFVCGFHVAFIAVHISAYLGDVGLPDGTGAVAISIVGLFNVIGSYMAGVMGGHFSKKYLLSFLYFGRAVVIAVFILVPPSLISVYIFAGTMGLLWLSTVPLTSGLVAQIFGTRHMSMLFGFVFFSHQVGAFIGAWLGGALFDSTGSYDLAWWVAIALGVIAGAVHWPVREQPIVRPAAA